MKNHHLIEYKLDANAVGAGAQCGRRLEIGLLNWFSQAEAAVKTSLQNILSLVGLMTKSGATNCYSRLTFSPYPLDIGSGFQYHSRRLSLARVISRSPHDNLMRSTQRRTNNLFWVVL